MDIVLFFAQILLLFFLSQQLTKKLSQVFFHFFKSQKVVIHILSFLFLPGVIVHELAHLMVANLLFVPTGEVEFLPEIHGNEVKMGSVAIAKTDPLRRFLIGAAPLFVGLFVLFLLFWYFYPVKSLLSFPTALLLYAVFQVSNTMFSSRKDMEGAIGLLVLLALVTGSIIFFSHGIPAWGISFFLSPEVQSLTHFMNLFLFLAVFIDVTMIALALLFLQRRKYY